MPKLSIITININDAEGVEKTIRSVIAQTFADFEYIVIDGGSTDNSVNVIKKYADKISFWVSELDTGIYNAMNKGILKASGEYCQFLNSGDMLATPDVTEQMLKNMPKCSILYGNMIKKVKGNVIIDRGFKGKLITLMDMFDGTINHSSAYIKRDLFDKYGLYDETLKIVSDWKFFFIAVGLNNEMVAYRDIEVTVFDMNGISNIQRDLIIKERKYVIEKLFNENILADLKEWNFFREICRRMSKYSFIWFLIKSTNFVLKKLEGNS